MLAFRFTTVFIIIALQSMAAADTPPGGEKPPDTPAPASAAPADNRTRVELNLLGKENTAAGESRRNENIQFNLVDNNALKELNVRLGATATILDFRPDQNYFGSEFGNVPAQSIHMAPLARAGWHGNLFFNHQNSVFSARSFFQVGGVMPAHENRYGFATGLRPWRGGYVSLQGGQEKLRGFVNGNVLVPMPDERTPLITDPARRAIVERFLSAYPTELPNRTDINPRALNTNAPQTIDGDNATVRVEQDVTSRDRLLSMYRFIDQRVDAFQLVAGQNPDTHTMSHRGRLTWVRAWSPALTTNFSAGFDRIGSLLVPDASAVGPMISTAGLTTLGPSGIIPIDRAQNLFHYEGQVNAVRSKHTWMAGFALVRRQLNGTETDTHRGYFSFSNDFGRSGIENLRMGTPSQAIIAIGDVHRGFRQWISQVYAGDVWRATANLTFNIGLRYEAEGRPYEVNHLNTIPYACDCNNVAPQFGFAWRLPDRWGVMRGAYGLQYGEIFPVTYSQVRFSPPGSTKWVITAPDLIDPFRSNKQTGEAADALGNIYEVDPNLVAPYSHQYNFSWEPALSKTWRVQFGYVGSRSPKLLVMWYLNRAHPVEGIPQTTATINQRRPNPGLAEIRDVVNGSFGYFDAARVTVIAPRVHGFTIDAAYWFSKAMDLGADYTNTAYDVDSRLSRSQSEFETHKDRKALSNFDQPHSLLARASYEFPAHARGWMARVMNGWMASAVVLLKNGTPFTVTTPDGPGFGNVDGNGNDRPNLMDTSVLGRTIGNPDTSVALLPKSAFTFMAPTDQAGSLGANVFRRGAIHNVNAAVTKVWQIHSERRLTFRAESINLTNTPQFAEPGSVLGTPEFATITNTLNDGRTLRMALSFGW